jgi:uncharacterized membrane protein YdcZ (DUF606 family)
MPSKIGMIITFISIVLGQILGALVFDALGLFGADVRDVTIMKISGVALVIIGVISPHVKVGITQCWREKKRDQEMAKIEPTIFDG